MKNLIITLIILLAAGLNNSKAQDTWTKKVSFGGTARDDAFGFSIGSKGYIGGGTSNNGSFSDFWEYDPISAAWMQKADFGGGVRYAAAGFSIGNKGYIGTGGDGSIHPSNTFWEYDPFTNVWTQKADFGGGGRLWAVGFSIGGKGYIGTGYWTNDF